MASKSNRTDRAEVAQAANLFARLGPITYRSLSELKPYKRNPRQHPERQLVGLTASIQKFGFVVPVLIDDNDEVIAGEARIVAAGRAGLNEVPTIRTRVASALVV